MIKTKTSITVVVCSLLCLTSSSRNVQPTSFNLSATFRSTIPLTKSKPKPKGNITKRQGVFPLSGRKRNCFELPITERVDRTFHRYAGVITYVECWENTRKIRQSRAGAE